MTRRASMLISAALIVGIQFSLLQLVQATEPVLELRWAELVPPAPSKPLKSFFADRPEDIGRMGGMDDGSAAPPPQPEGRWMSQPGRSPSVPTPVVKGLDGKRVRIGGYIVPLDFAATEVKEFLLVPFIGACIHVPPPPANQIIYVKSAKGVDVKGTFDPVYVTGTLRTEAAFTGLAEAGYSVNAEAIETRKE